MNCASVGCCKYGFGVFSLGAAIYMFDFIEGIICGNMALYINNRVPYYHMDMNKLIMLEIYLPILQFLIIWLFNRGLEQHSYILLTQ